MSYIVWTYTGKHEWTPMPATPAMTREKADALAASLRKSLHPDIYTTAAAFPAGVNPND